jgi:hypothetical protein
MLQYLRVYYSLSCERGTRPVNPVNAATCWLIATERELRYSLPQARQSPLASEHLASRVWRLRVLALARWEGSTTVTHTVNGEIPRCDVYILCNGGNTAL